jgi:hypothetical protein
MAEVLLGFSCGLLAFDEVARLKAGFVSKSIILNYEERLGE